jgi:hypothetical protein
MYRIYCFRFDNYSGARIIVLPTLGEIWKSYPAAFVTTT